jgi:hypothetical protein
MGELIQEDCVSEGKRGQAISQRGLFACEDLLIIDDPSDPPYAFSAQSASNTRHGAKSIGAIPAISRREGQGGEKEHGMNVQHNKIYNLIINEGGLLSCERH